MKRLQRASDNWQINFKSLRRRFLIERALLVVTTVTVNGSPSQRLMSTRIAQQRKTHGGRSCRPSDMLIKLLGCRVFFHAQLCLCSLTCSPTYKISLRKFLHTSAYSCVHSHNYHLGHFFTHLLGCTLTLSSCIYLLSYVRTYLLRTFLTHMLKRILTISLT